MGSSMSMCTLRMSNGLSGYLLHFFPLPRLRKEAGDQSMVGRKALTSPLPFSSLSFTLRTSQSFHSSNTVSPSMRGASVHTPTPAHSSCPTRVSYKSVPEECPTRVSYRSVRQESVPEESPTRVFHKSVPQECPIRVTHKSVPQERPTRVSYKSVIWTYVAFRTCLHSGSWAPSCFFVFLLEVREVG